MTKSDSQGAASMPPSSGATILFVALNLRLAEHDRSRLD